MKKEQITAKGKQENTRENRTFPLGKAILFLFVLLLQIGFIAAAFCYDPTPQDIIRQYDVTVDVCEDGSLDISYHFVWEAMDPVEELTWIEIGTANGNYSVYPDSVSETIFQYTQEFDGARVYLVLDLDRAYTAGEVLEFSFKINQKNMLCKDDNGYFYEFVPGWFNATPVERYTFRWVEHGHIQSASGAQKQDGYYTWSGSLDCGGYTLMHVRYGQDCFTGCETMPYVAFDGDGANNSLQEDKTATFVLAFLAVAFLIIIQVWVVDSVVSYQRGRGFLTGHGFPVHTYGRPNPRYIMARDHYNAMQKSKSGHHHGFGGGGCACACACACAGGGRAGCSQKDTFDNTKGHKNSAI